MKLHIGHLTTTNKDNVYVSIHQCGDNIDIVLQDQLGYRIPNCHLGTLKVVKDRIALELARDPDKDYCLVKEDSDGYSYLAIYKEE